MSQLITDELGQAFEIVQDNNSRIKGFTSVYTNISVVNNLTKSLSASFGPCGLDVILQSKDDEITVTNDGATILQEMDMSDNPISQLITQLSQSQDDEVGDGTTGIVLLANALLQQSVGLLEKGIHPIRIAENYDACLRLALKHLDMISEPIKNKSEAMMNAARTSLCSKVVSKSIDKFANICVDCIMSIADVERKDVSFDLINFETKTGTDVSETELIKGMLINKEFSHPQMTKVHKKAKVALLACPLEPPKLKNKHSLLIKNSEEYEKLAVYEQEVFLDIIKHLKEAKTDIVLCQWGFDDEANSLLFENNLPACRWVGGNDLDLIALHIGGNIISRVEDIREEDLGVADVEEMSFGTESDKCLVIKHPSQSKAVTIVIKGANDMILKEARRSLQDGLCAVRNVLLSDRYVYGGGSAEVSLSIYFEETSKTFTGEEEECMRAFGRALEEIPITLARNSGLDSLNVLTELRKKQVDTKCHYYGVDCLGIGNGDMTKMKVFDTLGSKKSQLQMANQLVGMILKIDDIIMSSNK